MKNLEFNKISASILLAGVIAMISGFITNILYQPEDASHMEKRGFMIEMVDESHSTDDVVKINVAALIADADATKGAKIVKKCVSCHSFNRGGADKVGPNLYGIIGKNIASNPSYSYSKSLLAKEGIWNEEEIFHFLSNPKKYVSGTKMSFAGIRKPKQLANLIAFLKDE